MAPSIVGGATNGFSGGTSWSVTTPTHSVGDLLILVQVQDNPTVGDVATFSATGWTWLLNTQSIVGQATLGVAYKIAGSSEPATFTVSSDNDERTPWVCFAVTGHDGIAVSAASANTGSGTSPTFPGVSVPEADCLVLALLGTDGISTPHTPPSGYTAITEVSQSSGGSVSAHYKVPVGVGTETPGTATISSEDWAGFTLAVAPAAGGGGGHDDLTVGNFDGSAPVLDTPALTQHHVLTVGNLDGSSPTLGTPALTQHHVLAVGNLDGAAPVLDTPELSEVAGHDDLTVGNLDGSAPVLGTPALTQHHVLAVGNLDGSAPILATPSLTQHHVLGVGNFDGSAPLLGTPYVVELTGENIAYMVLALSRRRMTGTMTSRGGVLTLAQRRITMDIE